MHLWVSREADLQGRELGEAVSSSRQTWEELSELSLSASVRVAHHRRQSQDSEAGSRSLQNTRQCLAPTLTLPALGVPGPWIDPGMGLRQGELCSFLGFAVLLLSESLCCRSTSIPDSINFVHPGTLILRDSGQPGLSHLLPRGQVLQPGDILLPPTQQQLPPGLRPPSPRTNPPIPSTLGSPTCSSSCTSLLGFSPTTSAASWACFVHPSRGQASGSLTSTSYNSCKLNPRWLPPLSSSLCLWPQPQVRSASCFHRCLR